VVCWQRALVAEEQGGRRQTASQTTLSGTWIDTAPVCVDHVVLHRPFKGAKFAFLTSPCLSVFLCVSSVCLGRRGGGVPVVCAVVGGGVGPQGEGPAPHTRPAGTTNHIIQPILCPSYNLESSLTDMSVHIDSFLTTPCVHVLCPPWLVCGVGP
jgi:hypothetical protein